jgi:diguanylate cyclase (GGDEF)-like protein
MRLLFLGGGRSPEELIGDAGAEAIVETTAGLGEALRRLDDAEFDAILVDLTTGAVTDPVPALGGAAPKTPIVVLTGAGGEDEGLRAIRAGAQDDVGAGEATGPALLRRIRYAIERKKREGALARHARYDPLTDLANRALFRERLGQALARADRTGKTVAVLWLDLDGFKEATAGWSREDADELIRQAGVRLHRSVRQVDTVARPGGDEFTILLEGLTGPRDAEVVARKIAAALTEPLVRDAKVTASAGISWYPGGSRDRDDLLDDARAGLAAAKDAGGAVYRFQPEPA